MPTPSTLIIYIPYVIKAPHFLLCHSWDIFTMSLISQNVLILLYMKQSLPHSFKTPWTIFSLALPPFLRDLLFPSLFYLLTNPCAFPIYLAKIWQLINVLWYLVTLPGAAGGRKKPHVSCFGEQETSVLLPSAPSQLESWATSPMAQRFSPCRIDPLWTASDAPFCVAVPVCP